MRVSISINGYDQGTSDVAAVLSPAFDALSKALGGEYGGIMEHLWIAFELLDYGARPDGLPTHPFRFQKRVSGRSHFGLPRQPDTFNVGHFSVRPDAYRLCMTPFDQAVDYAVSLIYKGTEALRAKAKRLGGFDAERFRGAFREACDRLGYRYDACIDPNRIPGFDPA